jgi:hypothetical protein
MSLVTQIAALVTRVGTEFKAVRAVIGNLANLTTTAKGDVVSAINEIKAAVASASGINDGATSTTTAYSSQKVTDLIAASKTSILGTASAAYDTLKEIQDLMVADDTETTGILTSLGNRLRFDAAQTLTSPQKVQALANLDAYSTADVGSITTDFVAAFNAAIA